jgi:ComF family protein
MGIKNRDPKFFIQYSHSRFTIQNSKILFVLQKIKSFFLDTLFPLSCLSCGSEDTWLCPTCLSKIRILSSQVCPYCEKVIAPVGSVCPHCKDKFYKKDRQIPLDALVSCASYQDSSISRLIHYYKYNFITDLRLPLGEIMTRGLVQNNLPLPDLIIPIPLHPRRLRWRGFNQAELLSQYISEHLTPGLNIPVFSNVLTREKYTAPQMKIKNYQERKKNVSGAFSICPPSPVFGRACPPARQGAGGEGASLAGKTVLLIDDICTTGSTLFEAARVLKQNGAKKVFAAVIARQEIKK